MDPAKKREYCGSTIAICPDSNSALEQKINFQNGVKSWLTNDDYGDGGRGVVVACVD